MLINLIIFYDEMGFSKSDIAVYSKGLGWITTIVFTLIGGWFSIKSGVVRALFISGVAMAITNVMFSFMAWSEKSELLFAAAVILDDLAANLPCLLQQREGVHLLRGHLQLINLNFA